MGEALSIPEGPPGQDIGAEGSAQESVLLSQLIQLLHGRERNSLLLSDLGALLPSSIRQRVKDQGGLRSWLQRYSSLFSVVGQPGKESVTLCLGAAQQHMQSETTAAPGTAAQDTEGAAMTAIATDANDDGLEEDIDSQSAVQLRGLPYRATVEDIVTFLGEHSSDLTESNPVQLVQNRDGRPSGFARVQFSCPESAKKCVGDLHLRSMDDRYVEVFLFSERPSKGRQRRGGHEDGTTPPGDPARLAASVDTSGVTREQVVRECRMQMADIKNRRLLLSMLGVALSPGARSYLKQMDQGLKHFLTQYPTEFSVDGGKGCEYVSYTPTQLSLSQAIDGFDANGSEVGSLVPASPKPGAGGHNTFLAASPGASVAGLASASRNMPNTPSDWGTPALQQWPAPNAPWVPAWPQGGGAPMPTDWNSGMPGGMPGGFPAWPMAGGPGFGMAGGFPGWPGYPPWGAPVPGMEAPPAASAADVAAVAATFGTSMPPEHMAGSHLPSVPTAGQAPSSATASGAPTITAVRLRGLPFTSVEQDVLAFFAQHDIVDRIADGPKAVNILTRSNGRPSGQAIVQMSEPPDAEIAQRVLHGQWMGSRYIEVFLLTAEENEAQAAGQPSSSPTKSGQQEPISLSMGVPPPVAAPPNTAPQLPPSVNPLTNGAHGYDPGMPGQIPPWQLGMWSAAMASSMPPPLSPGDFPAGGAQGNEMQTSWEALFEFLGPESAAAMANGMPPPPMDFAAMAGLGPGGYGMPPMGPPDVSAGPPATTANGAQAAV